MTEVVQQQFQLNRKDEFMKVFIQDAIARVVMPLRDASEVKDLRESQQDDWEH
jgi:hypothetical protein